MKKKIITSQKRSIEKRKLFFGRPLTGSGNTNPKKEKDGGRLGGKKREKEFAAISWGRLFFEQIWGVGSNGARNKKEKLLGSLA